MNYRKFKDTYYMRCDKGEEIITCILSLCETEKIGSCTFLGIGGLDEAELQTFLPETGTFETENISGMLELLSLVGNITTGEDGEHQFHAHSVISYKKNGISTVTGGHTKSLRVKYTGEIEIRPVLNGTIYRGVDPETGTGFFKFNLP